MDRNLSQVALSLIYLLDAGKITLDMAQPYMRRFGYDVTFETIADMKNALRRVVVASTSDVTFLVVADNRSIVSAAYH